MKVGVLFSGGKDSAIAALLLSRDYEVELNTFVFDPERRIDSISHAASVLDFPLKRRVFGTEYRDEVIDMLVGSGYPNNAINHVHRTAIFALCRDYDVVGDGTRLNDRVPMLSAGEVQRIDSRFGCSYVRPLLGFGKVEVQRLARRHLVVHYGESGEIENGDYENEIRETLKSRGIDPENLFPANHQQSLVVGTAET
jgi:predicted subunit of tRNA(5-methylaminomethyl-2-thiouridylate) methyltransferase